MANPSQASSLGNTQEIGLSPGHMEQLDAEGISLEDALQQADSSGLHAQKAFYISCSAATVAGMCGAVAPFLMSSVPEELDFEEWQVSLLASSTFWGMWAGSFLGGVSCDAIGPGRVMLFAMMLCAVFGAAPAAFPAMVIPARILCGLAISTTYLSMNTYVAEWASTERRGPYLSALHIWIAVGSIATVLLAIALQDFFDIGWRPLIVLNSIPPVIALVFSVGFVLRSESPRWLLVSGPPGSCRQMLGGLASTGGGGAHTLPPISIQQQAATGARSASFTSQKDHAVPQDFTVASRCKEMLGMWRLLVFGCILAFCLNFGSKGSEIWVGTFVKDKGLEHLERVVYLCVQTGKIAGDILIIYLTNSIGRLRCLQLGFALSAITTFGFTVPAPAGMDAAWLLSLAFLQGAGMDLLWCALYIYLAEIFPTTIRSTGFGLSMGLGRFGGIVSTSIGNLVPSMSFAFSLYAASFGIGTLAAFLPGPETAQSSLADTSAK